MRAPPSSSRPPTPVGAGPGRPAYDAHVRVYLAKLARWEELAGLHEQFDPFCSSEAHRASFRRISSEMRELERDLDMGHHLCPCGAWATKSGFCGDCLAELEGYPYYSELPAGSE